MRILKQETRKMNKAVLYHLSPAMTYYYVLLLFLLLIINYPFVCFVFVCCTVAVTGHLAVDSAQY